MVAGPSDISGNRQLGPENRSPTSDRLSDVKFGTNLDVLAEITVRETHQNQNSVGFYPQEDVGNLALIKEKFSFYLLLFII